MQTSKRHLLLAVSALGLGFTGLARAHGNEDHPKKTGPVRKEQKRGDYSDPGWYQHPPGTVAYEFTGALPDPARFKSESAGSMPAVSRPAQDIEVKVRKPSGGHASH